MNTSFPSLILAHFAALEGLKTQKQIFGMKDYLQIKHELKEGIAPAKDIEGVGRSATLGPRRSFSSRKLLLKHTLDISPPSDKREGKHKKLQRRGKNKQPVPRYVCSSIPPPVRHRGGVNIREGGSTPRRSARTEALNSSDKDVVMEEPNNSKAVSCIQKGSRCQGKIDAPGSSSSFMSGYSSSLMADNSGDMHLAKMESVNALQPVM